MPKDKENEVEKRKKQLEEEQKKIDEEQKQTEANNLEAKRIEEKNTAEKRLEDAQKEALALAERRKALGGDSDAGEAKEKPPEETPKEYADRVMKGEA